MIVFIIGGFWQPDTRSKIDSIREERLCRPHIPTKDWIICQHNHSSFANRHHKHSGCPL